MKTQDFINLEYYIVFHLQSVKKQFIYLKDFYSNYSIQDKYIIAAPATLNEARRSTRPGDATRVSLDRPM